MPQCDFNKAAKQISPVNLLHMFRKTFLRSTSGWLLLNAVTVLCKSYNQRSIQNSVKHLR